MVRCVCGTHFCLRCGNEAHAPVLCAQLLLWAEKCRNESETANWILANTKKCPKCSIRIEKNQGCNHMTCRSCQYDFCWTCMGDWKAHGTSTGGYYKCNRYEPDAGAGLPDEANDAARAKAELDRYLHYYKRYANHEQSGRLAVRNQSLTESRMVALQESLVNTSWIDVQFLKGAAEQLVVCRRVLKYTYCFAYYLPEGKEKNLFEYLQENLEKNTEHLTGLTEMPIEQINRAEMINYTRVTERFLQNLLQGVSEGLTTEYVVGEEGARGS
jgi:ariadne-1